MSPFLSSLSKWSSAVVLRSVSEKDTVGIRTASARTDGRTDTDGQVRPPLGARARSRAAGYL